MLLLEKIQASPRFRLVAINLISVCVLAGAFLIIFQIFGQMRVILEDQVDSNVKRAAKSYALGKDLIGLEVEVHDLLNRSHNDPEELIRGRHRIISRLDALIIDVGTSDNFFNYDRDLDRDVVREYRDVLEKVLEETIAIDELFLFLDMQNRDFIVILTNIEEDVGEFILKAALSGKDLTHLHQINALLPFCREQVLKVRFIVEKTVNTMDSSRLTNLDDSSLLGGAQEHLEVLSQTLETITASEPVFSDNVQDILSNIVLYKTTVNRLSTKLTDLAGLYNLMFERRKALLGFLEKVDRYSITTLSTLVRKNSLKIQQSIQHVYVVAAIVLLVTLTAAFIINLLARKLDATVREAEQAKKILAEKVSNLDDEMIRRAEAEREVQAFNRNLETVVQKRTADLALANKELESFVDAMSHNLRTPLRGISGFSHILKSEYGDVIPGQGQGYLTRILDACRDMAHIIDAILNLNRYSKREIREVTVDLTEMALSVVDALKRNAPERDIEITISPGMTTLADSVLARVVLESLFDNAWKFTAPKQHAAIEFSSTRQKSGTIFYIKDNGVGFDNAYAAKIFQPFQKLHPLKDFTGAGMGLSLVHRIILRHRGEIWGEGEEGHGAIFYFHF